MNNNIVALTTFPSHSWEIYAKKMLESFVRNWPADIPLLVHLDDDLLVDQIDKILRPQDGMLVGWDDEHAAFVKRNKDKDHPTDYRKQATRFCHKVFALKESANAAKRGNGPRYMIWFDADVIFTRPVTREDIEDCLPREGDAVAYLGRKDWDHSECGWLAFDLEQEFIQVWADQYISDNVFKMEQWHDSYVFDYIRKSDGAPTCTNLTEGKPGTEIWEQSPMAAWSKHYKGPVAKQELYKGMKPSVKSPKHGNVVIQTRNALSDEELQAHISENQKLIKNWVAPCLETDEEIIVVSAGPTLIAEDLRAHKGKKIVAVKHALTPLKQAGIKPWACILLDPRPHMMDFVKDADPDVIWFVASQVNPQVTMQLIANGCTIYGYHASVNASEGYLTAKQPGAVIGGGTATATRGLSLLYHLGFRNLILFGYDLCYPDRPDMKAVDDIGQPKYLDFSLGSNDPLYPLKKHFFSEPQLIAQYEEMQQIIEAGKFNIQAYGEGIVPFLMRIKNITDLRRGELTGKMKPISSYKRLIKWNNRKKTQFWLRKLLTR